MTKTSKLINYRKGKIVSVLKGNSVNGHERKFDSRTRFLVREGGKLEKWPMNPVYVNDKEEAKI
jgi:hypothetical protein